MAAVLMAVSVSWPTDVRAAGPGTHNSYLFVFEGRNAELKPMNSTGTKLKLSVPLRGQSHWVTWFTDRPARDAGHVTMRDFVGLWDSEATSGFRGDPPNVAIDFGDVTLIATMTNPRIVSRDRGRAYLMSTLTLVKGQNLDAIARGTSALAAHAKRAGGIHAAGAIQLSHVSVFVDISPTYFNFNPGAATVSEGLEVA